MKYLCERSDKFRSQLFLPIVTNMNQSPTLPEINATDYVMLDLALIEPNEGQLQEQGLPANPRDILTHKYDLLKENITNYPQFLKYNALKVLPMDNGHYLVIGGNMRCRALKELGFTKCPCAVIDPATPIEDLKAFVILDNSSFGRWEWSMVANEWDNAQMQSWGVDLPLLEGDVDIDQFFEEQASADKEKGEKITVTLPPDADKDLIKTLIKEALVEYPDCKEQ